MTWTYYQSTGRLEHDGFYVDTGYSGKGEGKNNPDKENVESVGPIPKGKYSIGQGFKHPTKGPVTMRLEPTGGQKMYGRAGMLIHGDNASGDASEGCIILGRATRDKINDSTDKVLEVVR